jgi:hypothetical protein
VAGTKGKGKFFKPLTRADWFWLFSIILMQGESSDANQPNPHIFFKAIENNFVLLTDKPGGFCWTGESSVPSSKSIRLVACCGPSLTQNEFNLRFYCVDSLDAALQVRSSSSVEVLRMLIVLFAGDHQGRREYWWQRDRIQCTVPHKLYVSTRFDQGLRRSDVD